MEYDQVASKERLTGRAFFFGDGDNGWIDLGNIQLMNLDYGIKRKEHFKARRGALIADRFDAYSATPRWEISGDEFTTSTLSLIFLGTVLANVTQSATTGGVVTITVRTGKWVDIATGPIGVNQRFGLSSQTTVTTPAGKSEGFNGDYVIDRGVGKIYIPYNSTIADGTSVTVQFWQPALTYNKIFPPLSDLNRSGQMQIVEEDDSTATVTGTGTSYPPKTIHDFPVSLSTDSGGQTRVDDYKSFKMIATITDPAAWVIRKRDS
jgi:hypothetical protein